MARGRHRPVSSAGTVRRTSAGEEQVLARTSRATRVVALLTALLVAAPAVAVALEATDPRRSQLWWFDTLGIEEAWDTSQGDGVVVAVLDTGADLGHPDLVGQFATAQDGRTGRDFVDEGDVTDPNGHGTIVTGLVAAAANNGEGVAGVAPAARVLPVRVLDADGRGSASTVDAAIRWSVDNGADVINLSLEVEETDGGPDATLTAPNAAIEYAWERGVVVVAATGNSGAGAAGYPEGSPVLLVGASEREDQRAAFSDAERLDAVMAPGVDMVSTWCSRLPDGGCDPELRYGIGDGTSFAAPVAAGAVALLLGSGLDHEQAVRVLRETAVDLGPEGPDETFGVGRIDARAALAAGATLLASGEEEPASPAPAPTATTDGQATTAPAAPGASPSADEVAEVPEGADPAPAPDAPLAADGVGAVSEEAVGGLAAILLVLACAGTLHEFGARRRLRARPSDGR